MVLEFGRHISEEDGAGGDFGRVEWGKEVGAAQIDEVDCFFRDHEHDEAYRC
jgi:hypothetical protein